MFLLWINPMKTTIQAVLVLGCAATAAACADSIVQPNGRSHPSDPPAFSQVSPASPAAAAPSPFVCGTALRTPDERHPWRYGSVAVRFPTSEQAPDGRMMTYRYEGYDADDNLVAVAVCRIPATLKTIRRMNRLLKVNARLGPSDLDASTAAYAVERMVVTACGPGYTGDYPSCLPDPTPVEIPADGTSGGFWGAGYVPPAPPPDPAALDFDGDTVTPNAIPDCTQPQEQPWARAYCRAAPPVMNAWPARILHWPE
jgi:hypothetical protein